MIDWNATSAIVAIVVFVFTGATALVAWVFRSRLDTMEGVYESQLGGLREAVNSRLDAHAQSTQYAIELTETRLALTMQLRDLEQTIEHGSETLDLKIRALSERLDGTSVIGNAEAWAAFVDALSSALLAMSSMIDWHSSLLDRLMESSPQIDIQKARASTKKLSASVQPRLYEVDLFSTSSDVRNAAARALADGIGDLESARRMASLLAADAALQQIYGRLMRRLNESPPMQWL